jgi:hypothetical protein
MSMNQIRQNSNRMLIIRSGRGYVAVWVAEPVNQILILQESINTVLSTMESVNLLEGVHAMLNLWLNCGHKNSRPGIF